MLSLDAFARVLMGLGNSMLSIWYDVVSEIDDDSVLSPQSYLHLLMHGGD